MFSMENFMSDRPTFFRPTDNFWNVITKIPWRYKKFVDIGSGTGQLTKLMREKEMTVEAVDKYKCDNCLINDTIISDVYESLGTTFMYLDAIIMARPAHDDLPYYIAKEYLETGDVFYISKRENLEKDLRDCVVECLAESVGEDKENLYRILYVPETRQKAYTYKSKKYCIENSRSGWIAPDGTWYGCNYMKHDEIAELVIGASVGRIEDNGFIRCQEESDSYPDSWQFGIGRMGFKEKKHKITNKQATTLKQKGYKLKNY